MNPETRLHLNVIRWWAYAAHGFGLDERTLLHCANGGKRGKIEGAIFKGMGVRRGAPDLLLFVPRGAHHGLALELKSPDGRLSIDQAQMLALFETHGWAKSVCWSFDEAVGAITRYLKSGDPLIQPPPDPKKRAGHTAAGPLRADATVPVRSQ